MKIVYSLFLFALINVINAQVPGFGRDEFMAVGAGRLNQINNGDRLPPVRIHVHDPAMSGGQVPQNPALPAVPNVPLSNSLNPLVVTTVHTPVVQNSQMPVQQMKPIVQAPVAQMRLKPTAAVRPPVVLQQPALHAPVVQNSQMPVAQMRPIAVQAPIQRTVQVLKQLPLRVQTQNLPRINAAQRPQIPLSARPVNFDQVVPVSNRVAATRPAISSLVSHQQRILTAQPVRSFPVQRLAQPVRLPVGAPRLVQPVRLPVNIQGRIVQQNFRSFQRPVPKFSPRVISPVQNRFVQG